jgi:hypothetical protein
MRLSCAEASPAVLRSNPAAASVKNVFFIGASSSKPVNAFAWEELRRAALKSGHLNGV